ncbi:MAG: hypothetical protein GY953_09045 [bacterium]|nr:hypothetical protein [bacterium]
MRILSSFLLLCVSVFAGGGGRYVSFSSAEDVIPHLVFGDTWNTSVTLVNLSHEEAQVPVKFFQQDGEPMLVPIADVGIFSELNVTIAAHGSTTFQTVGESTEPPAQGWAKLDLTCCQEITGLAVFQQSIGGQDSEAVVPFASSQATRAGMIFDNTAGFVTGMAMVNPSETSVSTVTMNFRLEDGSRIHLDQLILDPGEHRAFALNAAFPQTGDRRGTIEFLAHGGGIALLGLRFSPRGIFTSFHSFEPPPTP